MAKLLGMVPHAELVDQLCAQPSLVMLLLLDALEHSSYQIKVVLAQLAVQTVLHAHQPQTVLLATKDIIWPQETVPLAQQTVLHAQEQQLVLLVHMLPHHSMF
jgi:hypothetical protein